MQGGLQVPPGPIASGETGALAWGWRERRDRVGVPSVRILIGQAAEWAQFCLERGS